MDQLQLVYPGCSEEAEFVANETQREYEHLQSSNALGNAAVLDELGEVWEECRVENWDGFGAVPISQDTLRNAYILVESLPIGLPHPSVGAESDGDITLEWHRSPTQTLSVSIDPDGYLHYAGLFGPNRRSGKEVFYGELPRVIQQMVGEIYG